MNSRNFDKRATALSNLFRWFGNCLRSNEVRCQTRKSPRDFSRIYKFPWYDVLCYLIFRHEKCTQSEISSYYSSIGKPDLRISKQAAFKAVQKVRWEVFPILIRKLAEKFYSSSLVKTHKGYILLAEDGTTNALLPTAEALEMFGFVTNPTVKKADDAKKATSRSASLYDVTNGLIVNFSMNRYKRSEIPIAVEHLEQSHDLFGGKNVILLADRYYGGVEFFSIIESFGFNYCIRGKSNFFKKAIAEMESDDQWITVNIDKAWLKRLKYDQPKARFADDPEFRLRIVKREYRYFDSRGNAHTEQLIYFTNLPEEEFSTSDIISLYAKRWDVEVSYKTLKTDLEWERFFSMDCSVEMCSIYSKILFHNLNGIVRKEMNLILSQEHIEDDNKYEYTVNIAQLTNSLRDFGLCRYLRSGNHQAINKLLHRIYDLRHKIKVPVREGRHYKRWGRVVMSSAPVRFRLDGRNWPRVIRVKGRLQTIRP